MSYNFITFGAGNENYYQALNRLKNQAMSLKLFNTMNVYTDEFLKNDTYFWSKHGEFIEKNKRGYGYWLWKPYIIMKTMETLKVGDVLLYLDCGCEIDINKKNKLIDFFELVKTEKIIANTKSDRQDKYTKMDLLVEMNETEYSCMIEAGAILFFVCKKTYDFVKEWYQLCCEYHNIDDSPSLLENSVNFVEHRHDQSVFTILIKKYGLHNVYYIRDCVESIRNRTGVSKIDS